MKLADRLQMAGVVAILAAGFCPAQVGPAQPKPAAAQAVNPADTPVAVPLQHPDDPSALSSPLPPQPPVITIPVGSTVQVKMVDHVDSGANKNGDTVHAVLAAPVTTSKGRVLPTGSKVEATVVAAAPAGKIQSAGVLSLQLTRVGGVPVVSDVVDFTGQEGHKDVADSAPQKGTEAKVDPGAPLTFHVMENGPATGLDLAGAAQAKREGTVGGGSMDNAAKQPPAGPQAPAGSPNTQPGLGQSAAKGATPPPR